ncbi:MAG: sensor histidine kinase [Clostridiales bacterium]|jgi:two-component system sensor histidine kinase YesM|nr:sensor histidine kinase [Clostridiales bacterium]
MMRGEHENRGKFHCLGAALTALKTSTWAKVSIGFVLMGIVPVTLLSVMSFRQTKDFMHEQIHHYSAELLREASRGVGDKFVLLQNNSVEIAFMDEVQQLCVLAHELSQGEINRRIAALRLNISYKLSRSPDITDVFLYVPDGRRLVLYGDAGYQFNLPEAESEALLRDAYEKNGHAIIRAYGAERQKDGLRKQRDVKSGNASCSLIARGVRSLYGEDMLGVVVIRVNERFFSGQLSIIDLGDGAQIVIYDSSGQVIACTGSGLFPVGAELDRAVLSGLESAHIMIDLQIEDAGWTMLGLIPSQILNRRASAIFADLLILLFPIGAVVFLGMRLFGKILARPLTELVSAMNAVEGGDLDVKLSNPSPDEIGRAAHSFNEMLRTIRELLEDVKIQETQKRQAELAALQAQINPHFLSNTLNLARCMAQTQKAFNIDALLTALIDLLHVSMNLQSTLITIEEELSYIRSYIEIIRYRNYNTFDVNYDIQANLFDSLIPKLILQPIVENALTHGLGGKAANGQIIVRAVSRTDGIHIAVTDNGQGISPERISDILRKKASNNGMRFSGIGLHNVDERIKLFFGEQYGLYIESVCKMFTTVEIVIPNRKRVDRADSSIDCG